jgi:hypothetical protein
MGHTMRTLPRLLTVAATLGLLALATPAHAIIVLKSTDGSAVGRNTTAPSDPTNATDWQYVGDVNLRAAIPISDNVFLTAAHNLVIKPNPAPGDNGAFNYQGHSYNYLTDYTIVGVKGDLAVLQLTGSQTFTSHASLYNGPNEVGRSLFAVGRGVPPTTPVLADPNDSNSAIVGWRWAGNAAKSWGLNTVSGIWTDPDPDPSTNWGEFLRFDFDRNGGIDEGAAVGGDSGGGVFINGQLAGIISFVDGRFSYTENGAFFNASMFDMNGFYTDFWSGADLSNPGPYLVPNTGTPTPSSSYAIRLNSAENRAFLSQFVPIPEPGSLILTGLGLALGGLWALRRRKS